MDNSVVCNTPLLQGEGFSGNITHLLANVAFLVTFCFHYTACLVVVASMFMQEGHMARNLYIFSVPAVVHNSEDHKYRLLNDKLEET